MQIDLSSYIMPAIGAFTYLLLTAIKSKIPETHRADIPLYAALIGIGAAAWYAKSFDFSICLNGLASGLFATGIDQVVSIPAKKSAGVHSDGKGEGED